MLAVQRMVVLKHKHGYLCGLLILRFDHNSDASYGRCDGVVPSTIREDDFRAAHGMAVWSVSGVCIHRIARENRDVVTLRRIENDLAGIHWRLGGDTGAANTIAQIAGCGHASH